MAGDKSAKGSYIHGNTMGRRAWLHKRRSQLYVFLGFDRKSFLERGEIKICFSPAHFGEHYKIYGLEEKEFLRQFSQLTPI